MQTAERRPAAHHSVSRQVSLAAGEMLFDRGYVLEEVNILRGGRCDQRTMNYVDHVSDTRV